MRLPRQSLLLLLLLITLCLLVGMVIGMKTGTIGIRPPQASPTGPRATPTRRPTASGAASTLQPTSADHQQALLIVGVNDANALQPKLEGCWVIAFSIGINQYYVLSIPPEARFSLASLGANQTLADIYVQDVQQEVGYRFMRDAIRSNLPAMSVQAVVTIDRSDLADLATKLGGVAVDGQILQGVELAAAYDTQSFNGTAARMHFQHSAFESLFQALADQHWTPASVADYLEGLPHAVTADDAAALAQLAGSAPPLQSSELTWTVVGGDRESAPAP